MQGQNQSIDEEVAVSIQDDFSQKLDALMKVVAHLSRKRMANEEHQRQGEASSTSSPHTSVPRRRARFQGTHEPNPDIAK